MNWVSEKLKNRKKRTLEAKIAAQRILIKSYMLKPNEYDLMMRDVFKLLQMLKESRILCQKS